MTIRATVEPSEASAGDHAARFADLSVDHIDFYVTDLPAAIERISTGYGLDVLIPATHGTAGGTHESALLGRNRIRLRLTQALSDEHAAWTYVQRHGEGVGNIALRVPDARAAYEELVTRGAAPVTPPEELDGCVIATVSGFGDVVHTLVERASDVPHDRIPGLPNPRLVTDSADMGLLNIDHFAVCLPIGDLDKVTRFYTDVFDMQVIFEEKIEVGPMGMDSTVVQSPSGDVTFTLIEPIAGAEAGQIESFLTDHGGAGVQHVAFASDDIIHAVGAMGERGVAFLRTPATYYDMLTNRLTPLRHSIDDLCGLNILVDEDHDGQLFQIFTRSTHPRGTFFFEVIERIRARSFGSNNIRALYEAIELQRQTAGEPQ
ncbi:4-hydroxyphenylpyruvate dioxygenase [Streptomyces wuyuanensis]|uniref:4-hydroxyphenylpyruvate dioxygenase n=1 Tax=Streptomyces wuyuanensis TaxID=1196353 RepID=UPI003712C08B